MQSRFGPYKVATAIFQVICAIAVVIGISVMLERNNDNFAAGVPQELRVAGGFMLFFFGLGLFIVASGVQVLIGIDESTRQLGEKLGALTGSGMRPQVAAARAPLTPRVEPFATAPAAAAATSSCPRCNAVPVTNSVFCIECGARLSP